MANLNVLISGSGIAGGAFAFWLRRAYPNANITIVERTPELRLSGQGVDIRSSAVDIIRLMGAEEEIRKHSTGEEGVEFVTADGKAVATFKATGRTDIQSMTSEFEIFRGALAQTLIDPVLPSLQVIFDETVAHYERHDDGVDVTFTRSKEVKKYDLLVAADGLGSRIRGMMLNTRPSDQVDDSAVHAAYFTVKTDLLQGSRVAKWYNATGGRCIFVRPDPNPAGRSRVTLVLVCAAGDAAKKERLNDAMRQGNESFMKLMEEMFDDAGWLSPEVIQGMRDSDDFYCSLFAQVRSPKFQDGRVVLLGDAGHATPGIGTSLAIIGGYVLAGELLNHPGDVLAASKRYEELMLPFAHSMQGGMASGFRIFNPQTAWGLSVRNTILGMVSWARLDQLAMTVGAKLGYTEKKLALPDYPWPAV